MRAHLVVPLLVAMSACQQPAEKLDLDVQNLAKVAEAPAPANVTRTLHEPPPLRASATVSFSPTAMRSRSEVLSVVVAIDVIGASGGELALEVIAPDGTLYQRPTLPLEANPWLTQHLEFRIPVAGTWIDSMQLTGTWDTHLFLGPSELLHETFELTP